jgi:hypothetical protein
MKTIINSKFPPSDAQINFLGKLTGIKSKTQLGRYVARRLGRPAPEIGGPLITKFDISRAIDAEINERKRTN